jgi:hypothetical protein
MLAQASVAETISTDEAFHGGSLIHCPTEDALALRGEIQTRVVQPSEAVRIELTFALAGFFILISSIASRSPGRNGLGLGGL